MLGRGVGEVDAADLVARASPAADLIGAVAAVRCAVTPLLERHAHLLVLAGKRGALVAHRHVEIQRDQRAGVFIAAGLLQRFSLAVQAVVLGWGVGTLTSARALTPTTPHTALLPDSPRRP